MYLWYNCFTLVCACIMDVIIYFPCKNKWQESLLLGGTCNSVQLYDTTKSEYPQLEILKTLKNFL